MSEMPHPADNKRNATMATENPSVRNVLTNNVSVMTRPPAQGRKHVRVSVILPSYNFGAFIAEAIRSVQEQSFSDWELLIFDNGSSDNSHQVIGRFLSDERVSFQINESNVGLFGSVQRGIDVACGDYFVIMGADDILECSFLEQAVLLMDGDPAVSILHGAAIWIDEQGVPFGRTNDQWLTRSHCTQAFEEIFRLGFCLTTVVARTDLVRRMPPFNPTWNVMNDVWLMLRMALEGEMAYMNTPLVRYRVHAQSLSVTGYQTGDFFLQHLRIVKEAFDWPESRARGLQVYRASALRNVALESIRILHVSRLVTSRWFYLKVLMKIVRCVPSVLIYPEVWMRAAFGMLPVNCIQGISSWRRARWRRRCVAANNEQNLDVSADT
ncbi:MAG: glycosyltransferase [Planctomycetaceae bacterium]|nr:glycosyltransferase [Planctomycetaceae bacterium]